MASSLGAQMRYSNEAGNPAGSPLSPSAHTIIRWGLPVLAMFGLLIIAQSKVSMTTKELDLCEILGALHFEKKKGIGMQTQSHSFNFISPVACGPLMAHISLA